MIPASQIYTIGELLHAKTSPEDTRYFAGRIGRATRFPLSFILPNACCLITKHDAKFKTIIHMNISI